MMKERIFTSSFITLAYFSIAYTIHKLLMELVGAYPDASKPWLFAIIGGVFLFFAVLTIPESDIIVKTEPAKKEEEVVYEQPKPIQQPSQPTDEEIIKSRPFEDVPEPPPMTPQKPAPKNELLEKIKNNY